MKAAASAPPQPEAAEGASEDAEMADAQPGISTEPEGQLAGLTDAQLLQVFKQTSIFNVRSALAGNESLMDGDHMGEEGMDRYICQVMA